MEDAMRQSDKEKQARVLEKALTLSLADAVFMIVHYNDHYRWSHREPIELSILHDRHDPSEVEEWRLKALKLRADAYYVGDALLHNKGAYDRLRGELEAAYPGFNQNTYFEAVSYGSFCAR